MNHRLSVEQANEVEPLLNAYFKSSAIDRSEAYSNLMSKLYRLTNVDPSDEEGVKALKGQFLSRPLQDSIRPLQDSLEPSCNNESNPEEDNVIIIKRNNLVVCEEDVGYQDAQRQSILNVWSCILMIGAFLIYYCTSSFRAWDTLVSIISKYALMVYLVFGVLFTAMENEDDAIVENDDNDVDDSEDEGEVEDVAICGDIRNRNRVIHCAVWKAGRRRKPRRARRSGRSSRYKFGDSFFNIHTLSLEQYGCCWDPGPDSLVQVEYVVDSSDHDAQQEDECKTRIWSGNTSMLWPLLSCMLNFLVRPVEAASPEALVSSNGAMVAGLITLSTLAYKKGETWPKKTRRRSKRKRQDEKSGEYCT